MVTHSVIGGIIEASMSAERESMKKYAEHGSIYRKSGSEKSA